MNYKGYKHIRWEQRLKIEGALRTGAKPAAIAQELGVCKKTIYNEIARGMCVQQTSEYEFVERYCADVAERKYQENLRAKGPDIKLGKDFAFVEYIEDQIINKKRSPGAALAQIQIDGKKFDTEICETTLYNWIYRGDIFLNLTEADLLYKGERRNEGRKAGDNNRARPAKGDTIEQRPEEINSRETFGNWEMDSVMGCKGSKAALVVLTERLTRYPVIVRVPDHTMESVVRALTAWSAAWGQSSGRFSAPSPWIMGASSRTARGWSDPSGPGNRAQKFFIATHILPMSGAAMKT